MNLNWNLHLHLNLNLNLNFNFESNRGLANFVVVNCSKCVLPLARTINQFLTRLWCPTSNGKIREVGKIETPRTSSKATMIVQTVHHRLNSSTRRVIIHWTYLRSLLSLEILADTCPLFLDSCHQSCDRRSTIALEDSMAENRKHLWQHVTQDLFSEPSHQRLYVVFSSHRTSMVTVPPLLTCCRTNSGKHSLKKQRVTLQFLHLPFDWFEDLHSLPATQARPHGTMEIWANSRNLTVSRLGISGVASETDLFSFTSAVTEWSAKLTALFSFTPAATDKPATSLSTAASRPGGNPISLFFSTVRLWISHQHDTHFLVFASTCPVHVHQESDSHLWQSCGNLCLLAWPTTTTVLSPHRQQRGSSPWRPSHSNLDHHMLRHAFPNLEHLATFWSKIQSSPVLRQRLHRRVRSITLGTHVYTGPRVNKQAVSTVPGKLIDCHSIGNHQQPTLLCLLALSQRMLFLGTVIRSRHDNLRTAWGSRGRGCSTLNLVQLFLFSMPTVGSFVAPLSVVVTPALKLRRVLLIFLVLALAFFSFSLSLPLPLFLTHPVSMGVGLIAPAHPVDAILILDRLEMRLVSSAVLAKPWSSRWAPISACICDLMTAWVIESEISSPNSARYVCTRPSNALGSSSSLSKPGEN